MRVGRVEEVGNDGDPREVYDGAAPNTSTWPKPEAIHSALPPVQPFSEELLPVSFRPLVRDVAERMQVPMDYPAVVAVLCLAGAVNRRASIQPKAHDKGWGVVPNLWGGIIAPPGFMKSPVIQNVIRPLNQIQTEWRREHKEALEDHARAKEEYELRVAAWKEQYKANTKKGDSGPERPNDAPEGPKLRRLIVNDATLEALHQTMSENPAGVFAIRDELTGWWSTLGRAGREGERAFCLQAWNGDTGHTIDRIGRGTVHVDACCMSMLGGIQPARLRSYLVDALEDGPGNDGLIQRFQLLVWPDTESAWTYVDRAPDVNAEACFAQVLRKLVELDGQNPKQFHFAPDAQELFVDWLKELEEKVRGDELHPALISHLTKYRKLMPALSLLFELASQAAGNSQIEIVSLAHARMAAAWCEYLESHARRIYSCIVTPELQAARQLADKIKKRRVGAIYRKESRAYPYDASMRNLAKAYASEKWHPPRPWRSKEEGLMIRRYVFVWLTCRDASRPSGRDWARQLGISHTWLQKLVREFKRDPGKFRRIEGYGYPTLEQLSRAQEHTRRMRERGELRSCGAREGT